MDSDTRSAATVRQDSVGPTEQTPVVTSVRLNNDLSVAEFVELCRLAEHHGFDQVWVSNDLYLRAASVMVTAAAVATDRISLGIGVMNPYSMDAAEIAMMAGSLQEISGGRFLLGMGAGAAEFLGWAGIRRDRPLATTRQAVLHIAGLLAGRRTEYDPTSQAFLRFKTDPVPIYLGVMSPKMLALCGEIADGALPLLYPPEHFVAARDQIVSGARSAGRDPADLDIAAAFWVSIDDDPALARQPMADKIAYYGASFAPYLLQGAGLSVSDFAPIQAALQADSLAAASALVTDQMLRLGMVGNADDVIARCRQLLDAGARHLSFGPPLGPDVLAAVNVLGSRVLPALSARPRTETT